MNLQILSKEFLDNLEELSASQARLHAVMLIAYCIQMSGNLFLQIPSCHSLMNTETKMFLVKNVDSCISVLPCHIELNHIFCKNYASGEVLFRDTFLSMFIKESHSVVLRHE
jgi:hypothetical protein